MHYIDVYEGSEKRVVEKTAYSHKYEFKNMEEAILAVNQCVIWLIKNHYIIRVRYDEMSEMQRRYFESDGCMIYKIIKRYNESEYLKEKYVSQ